MCPIFSIPRVKKDETLKLSDKDKNGHWVLLICDFSLAKALLTDSLEPKNRQISENAVLNFVRNLFRIFKFFRALPGYRDDSDVILKILSIQSNNLIYYKNE